MNSSSTTHITADCLIDKKTYINFSRFHRFYARKNSWNMIIFPIMLLGFAIFNLSIGNNTMAFILLVICFLLPAGSITAYSLRTSKQIEVFKLNTPRIFYSLTFSEAGIHISNKKEKVDYEWSQVYKIYRTKNSIYLYMTPANAFIIPSACIKDHSSDDLWTLFRKYISDKKLITKKVIYE